MTRQLLESLEGVDWPNRYQGQALRMIAFPLGGIGTGTISLGGRGNLRDWEIFNRPDKGNDLEWCLPMIRTRTTDGRIDARVLEAQLTPPYERSHGLSPGILAGVRRLDRCRFTGVYPFAFVEFEDEELPVEVTLQAFNPLVPLDADQSGLPVAILRYHLRNPTDAPVEVSVAWTLPNPIGPIEGQTNEFRDAGTFQGILFANPDSASHDRATGTVALAVSGGGASRLPYWRHDGYGWNLESSLWRGEVQSFWREFAATGRFDEFEHVAPLADSDLPRRATVCSQMELAPQESAEVTFVIAWHLPHRTTCEWGFPEIAERTGADVGNHYATRFTDAWSVVELLDRDLGELEHTSADFSRCFVESTLPPPVIDAALNNISTLRTTTCFRTADGKFYAFEGCNDQRGCCNGTCTHVWNYEQATSFLFPELARDMRDTEFALNTDPMGRMSFRTELPAGAAQFGFVAADGQMGCIVKLYHDWRLSGDIDWLRSLWPQARSALEFCWIAGGWDADRDGVMEGVQHQTFDIEFYGPNAACQTWYLAALRAAEQMATALGDTEFADLVREVFEKGSRWTDENLFNGEYYEQRIMPAEPDAIAEGLRLELIGQERDKVPNRGRYYGPEDPRAPELQPGDACCVNQMVGQYVAHVAGLEHLLDEQNVISAALSVYRYNRQRADQEPCFFPGFAVNDEVGLRMQSWPRSPQPPVIHPGHASFMTGFEYAAGVHLLYEGRIDEGVEVIRNIRNRYDGIKRNPWNEAECGHHYARAMASWAALPALSGFQFNGITRAIQFRPRLAQDEFRCFWSTPSAWGLFRRTGAGAESPSAEIEVRHGELLLRSVGLDFAFGGARRVACGDRSVGFRVDAQNSGVTLLFDQDCPVPAGSRLAVRS